MRNECEEKHFDRDKLGLIKELDKKIASLAKPAMSVLFSTSPALGVDEKLTMSVRPQTSSSDAQPTTSALSNRAQARGLDLSGIDFAALTKIPELQKQLQL